MEAKRLGLPPSKYKGIYFIGTRQRQHLLCVGLFPVTGLYIQRAVAGSAGARRGSGSRSAPPPSARGVAVGREDPPLLLCLLCPRAPEPRGPVRACLEC